MASVLAQQQLTPRPFQPPMRLVQARPPFMAGPARPLGAAIPSPMGRCVLASGLRQPITAIGGIPSQIVSNSGKGFLLFLIINRHRQVVIQCG